jgi:hypothetical protein
MKTTLTELIEFFDNQDPRKTFTAQEVTDKLVEFEEKERHAIVDSYNFGWTAGFKGEEIGGNKHFALTYNPNQNG